MLIHNAEVTGSLTINNVPFNSGSFSGSFRGDGSQLTGVTGATTASYVEYSNVGNKPTLVSGSSQITYSGLSGIPSGIVSGSSQVSFNGIVDKPTLVSGSSQVTYGGLSGIPAGIVSGSAQVAALGFATTGSNTFQANQTITGSLFITQNLVVAGSSSIQYISSSVLDIADNIITVNAFNPGVRFGGLAVIDSGSSPQVSGSLLFDSIKDQWIFVHQNQAVVTSSVLLMGPETYNDLGNESYISANRLPKGSGVEHLRDSNITDTGTVVSVNSNTAVTGSFTVVSGSAVELQVTNTGVNIGSALTDSHIISGSLRVNPNGLFVSGSGNVGINTTTPSERLSVVGAGLFGNSGAGSYSLAISNNDQSNVRLRITNTGTGGQSFSIVGGNPGASNAGLAIFDETNSVTRLYISSTGNLGLRVTPSAWSDGPVLQVGNAGLASRTALPSLMQLSANQYWDGSNHRRISDGFATLYTQNIGGHNWDTVSSGSANSVITWTQAMTLTPSGNLGIANTSPQGLLQIGANALSNNSDASNAFNLKQTSTTAATGIYLERSGERKGYYMYVGGSLDSLTFQRNNAGTKADVMSLTRDGNVGIGTDSPNEKLQVGGAISATGTATTAFASSATMDYFSGATRFISRGGNNSTRGAYRFLSEAADGSLSVDVLSIASTGAATFSSSVTANGLNALGSTLNNGNAIRFYRAGLVEMGYIGWSNENANNSTWLFKSSNGNPIGFSADGTNQQLLINTSGNVGIGTTNPTYRTEVALSVSAYWTGTAFTGGNPSALSINNTTNGGYDPVLLLQQTDSGGTTKLAGGIGLVGTGPWTAGDNATQISDMYFLVRNSSGGISERMRIKSSGTVQPGANGTQDLGTSSLRWATVFTSDLSLSNGIGDYTIVEGENDLFLYNNKQNKVYKFVIEEVDPSTATPKKS